MSIACPVQDRLADHVESPTAYEAVRSKPTNWHSHWLKRGLRRGRWLGETWKSNRAYFMGLVASCFVLTLVAFSPALHNFIFTWTGHGEPSLSARLMEKPFYRSTLFRLFITWFLFALGYYTACFENSRFRIWRALAIVVAILYLGAAIVVNEQLIYGQHTVDQIASGEIYEQQWAHLQHLKIIEYPSINLHAFELREELRKRKFKTFAEFHQRVMEQYARDQDRLKRRWGSVADLDEQKKKTLYILNFVAGLWSYGNQVHIDKAGCVLCNEQNEWKPPALAVDAYLGSRIGCCTDFAFLTKSLLDHEGIENRLTSIPGHVFNEVRLNGTWCFVDATVNMFMGMSWEELYSQEHGRESVPVLIFQHPNLADERSAIYRSQTGHFRLLTLLRIANQPEPFRKTDHPSLPSYFD